MSRAILSVLLQIGFALPLLGQPYWLAASGDIFRCNIVWREYQPAIMPALPWAQELDYNLMHREGATNAPATRLQKQSGRDEHSIVADAQFVDPAQGDYRVKDGSPALSL